MSEPTTNVLDLLKSVHTSLEKTTGARLVVTEPAVELSKAVDLTKSTRAPVPDPKTVTGFVNFTLKDWNPARGTVDATGTTYKPKNGAPKISVYALICLAFKLKYSDRFARHMKQQFKCYVMDGAKLFKQIKRWAVQLDIWRFKDLCDGTTITTSGTRVAEAMRKLHKLERTGLVNSAFVKFMLPMATPAATLGDTAIDEFKQQGYTAVPVEKAGAKLEEIFQQHTAGDFKLSPQKRAWITRRTKTAALIGRQAGKTGSITSARSVLERPAPTAVKSDVTALTPNVYAINETNVGRVYSEFKLAHPLLETKDVTLFLGEERLSDSFRKSIRDNGNKIAAIDVHTVFVPGAVGGLFMPNYAAKGKFNA